MCKNFYGTLKDSGIKNIISHIFIVNIGIELQYLKLASLWTLLDFIKDWNEMLYSTRRL